MEIFGRVSELALLDAAMREPGRRPLFAVHGEPGIGKTSALRAFAARAEDEGLTVLWGSCYEGSLARPYGPWAEAITDALGSLSSEQLAEMVDLDAPVLAEMVPAIRQAVPNAPPPVSLGGADATLRLFDAVSRFLDALDSPIVVLDDLQWADTSTLDLLTHVALTSRAMILTALRGTDLQLMHAVPRRLAQIHRRRSVRYLRLQSLDREAATQLLEHTVGRSLDAGLVDAIYAEGGGNPFFLAELGRHLNSDQGAAGFPDSAWRPPESIRGAVGLRLAALSADTQTMLGLATAFTAGFTMGDLQAVTGFGEEQLLEALDEALEAELVRPIGAERYDFAHALVRHTLYDSLNPSRQARLHRRVAETLEEAHAGATECVAAELARQYSLSAQIPGAERGVLHARTAAKRARAGHAPTDAAVLLRMALELVGDDDRLNRAEVMGDLAMAYAEAAQVELARQSLESAVGLLEQSGADGEAIANLIWDVGRSVAPITTPMPPMVTETLQRSDLERGLTWARLSLSNRFFQGPPAGPVRVSRYRLDPEAVRIARDQGTEDDFASTIDVQLSTPRTVGRGAGDLRAASAATELAETTQWIESWESPAARLFALVLVSVRVVTMETWPDAERVCDECSRLADTAASLPARAITTMCRSALLAYRGDLAAAIEGFATARRLAARLPPGSYIPSWALLLESQTKQHVELDAEPVAEELWRLATRRTELYWHGLQYAAFAAQLFAQAGIEDRARSILGHIMPALTTSSAWDHTENNAVGLAGGAIWELRDPELAQALLPCVVDQLEVGMGDWYMTCHELTESRLQTLLDRPNEAADAFQRARDRVESLDQHTLRPIVDLDEATARLRFGQAGAQGLLAAAQTRFDELGMWAWVARVRRLQSGAVKLPDGLTSREGEILRMVAEGQTNRGIADELVVSVHTVERHIQNAYRKIGVHNRAEATAYALTRLDEASVLAPTPN